MQAFNKAHGMRVLGRPIQKPVSPTPPNYNSSDDLGLDFAHPFLAHASSKYTIILCALFM
jgi:hypothetical protein